MGEKIIELLSPGLMGSLIKNNNTLTSVKHYNKALCAIYNSKRPKKKINTILISSCADSEIYNQLANEYKDRLEKQLNKRVIITLLPADSPSTVDCMKIQVIGER